MSKGVSAKVICGRFDSKEIFGLQEEITILPLRATRLLIKDDLVLPSLN